MLGRSVKRMLAGIEHRVDELASSLDKSRYREYLEYAADTRRMLKNSFLIGIARGIGSGIGFTLMAALVIYILQKLASSSLPILGDFIADLLDIVESKR